MIHVTPNEEMLSRILSIESCRDGLSGRDIPRSISSELRKLARNKSSFFSNLVDETRGERISGAHPREAARDEIPGGAGAAPVGQLSFASRIPSSVLTGRQHSCIAIAATSMRATLFRESPGQVSHATLR